MKSLKAFSIVLVLTVLLALPTMADNSGTSLCNPGDILTPPCAVAQSSPDDPTAASDSNTQSTSVDFYPIYDVAMNALQGALTVY
jgi:hypothetical protein